MFSVGLLDQAGSRSAVPLTAAQKRTSRHRRLAPCADSHTAAKLQRTCASAPPKACRRSIWVIEGLLARSSARPVIRAIGVVECAYRFAVEIVGDPATGVKTDFPMLS